MKAIKENVEKKKESSITSWWRGTTTTSQFLPLTMSHVLWRLMSILLLHSMCSRENVVFLWVLFHFVIDLNSKEEEKFTCHCDTQENCLNNEIEYDWRTKAPSFGSCVSVIIDILCDSSPKTKHNFIEAQKLTQCYHGWKRMIFFDTKIAHQIFVDTF